MASDEKIKQEVWNGVIPVALSLAQNEVATLQQPEPYYLLAPRCSYFTLCSASAREHFLLATPVRVDEMWFDFIGLPLKWHYPIGVLFDLYASQQNLPWTLSVHFQGFPAQQLLRCPNEDTIKSHFMNALKEANYLKHGDNARVNALSIVDQNDLFEGLRKNNFELFWRANAKLSSDLAHCKNVPIRICRPSEPWLQEPITPLDENGQERTLGNVLQQLLPLQFHVNTNSEGVISYTTNARWLIHGISPPLETPILWLSQHLSHPDNFLYISILPAPATI
eukprot:TRINITY_DN4518_c0_g1_i1.p1 TRINITY_DN4518_c0_g1~~TRINITY_DN4518_c0_g1_i1.p1  ORF type:complete len:303 (-),score=85.96 TRINITY_DN4518_c0_g1_i1:61-900(-)